MKTIMIFFIALFVVHMANAQRGDMTVATAAQLTVPAGAQICADRIFANNPGYGALTIANANCLCPGMSVVPVELLAFSASADNGIVLLRWTTATELNCHGFEVQKAAHGGGAEWLALGFVEGAGSTTERRDYFFSDPGTNEGTAFYRLRIIDYDGSFAYSPVVEVRFVTRVLPYTMYPVYPNPATENITVSFTLPEAASVSLTLYTVAGTEVTRVMEPREFSAGFHAATLPTSGLSPGTYVIELQAGAVRRTQTVVLLQ
ncbi:MAG: T9SS type A sorting domain-containing protein [Bacteroidia bacterium]|nr:T9SS type A sorting domain-containing protein [Bacteroidia bacterium]